MSKYNKQNRLDEKAISILSDFFMNKHGDRFDLQFHGIKDNTPDTDGFLRLREQSTNKQMTGKYLNRVVFFQLKGSEKPIQNNAYLCKRRLVEFCAEINLPTILFVVGNLNKEAEGQGNVEIYWYYFSKVNVEILNEVNKPNSKNVTIHGLEPLKIGSKEHDDIFYAFVKKLAQKDNFLDLPKEILELTVSYKDKTLKVASILYLVGKATKTDKKNIAKMLKLKTKKLDDILSGLYDKKLIYKSNNAIIFKKIKDEFNRDMGFLLLLESISKLDLNQLLQVFSQHQQRVHIYKNLSRAGYHPLVIKFLKQQIVNF